MLCDSASLFLIGKINNKMKKEIFSIIILKAKAQILLPDNHLKALVEYFLIA